MSSVMRGALLGALLVAFALPVHANEITDKIIVTGGTVEEKVVDGKAVAIITYTRTQITNETDTGVGTLSFKAGSAYADILAVGGGGAGGRTSGGGRSGGGGGGGAGGFVELLNLPFKGSCTVVVGAGGAGNSEQPIDESVQGGDGTDTTVSTNAVSLIIAKGGGGGGASTSSTGYLTNNGRSGGSGGGGSSTYSSTNFKKKGDGGAGTPGQGNAGGSVNKVQYVAGGGGGAGGEGTTPTSATMAPTGGVGKVSAITGEWYAGGGAGADRRESGVGTVAGGAGGGGSGGDESYAGSRDATPNTGGGGGGGIDGKASGNGADGIVVIRLHDYLTGGVVLPTVFGLVYDGNVKTAAVETAYYTLSGDVTATAAGTNYLMTVTLTAAGQSRGWADPTDPRISGNTATVLWSIAKKPIATPKTTAASFTYMSEEPHMAVPQQGYKTSADDYTLGGDNTATNAGTYTVTATLVDAANTKWADGAANPRTLTWTIGKKKIKTPAKLNPLLQHVYNGEVQTGYVASVWYTFDENNIRTNAATYTVTATLVDDANTQWTNSVPNPRNDLYWTIKSAPVSTNMINVKKGLLFNATGQTAYDPTPDGLKIFLLSGNCATNAGDHVLTVGLNNPAGYDNYIWDDDETTAPKTYGWAIAKRIVTWPPDGALETYEYAANTLRQPVPPSDWYERSGTGGATNVGDYACTASLKYNDGVMTNVVWSDNSVADKTWDWRITPHLVDPPTIGSNFTYEESSKGVPKPQTVLTISAADDYEKVAGDNDLTQTNAGDYSFVLHLKDPVNYVWSDTHLTADQRFYWTVEKATNAITDVTLSDWQLDDTSPHEPDCTDVKFGLKSAVQYFWGLTKTGTVWNAWSAGVPTEVGTYYLKAAVAEAPNWHATEVIKRFCIWKHPADVFTDFADITITGDVAEKPVAISLSEPTLSGKYTVASGLPGFEYLRTGVNASELRFVLTNAVKLADQLLPFTNRTWNAGGVSTVWVQMPAGVTSPVTIRMYWHAADGNPQSDNYPEDVGASVAAATTDFTLVNREGAWIDYWTSDASITSAEHLYDDDNPWPTEADVTGCTLKSGGAVTRQVLKLPREEAFTTLQTDPGSYIIVYSRTAAASYDVFAGNQRVEYTIRRSNPYSDLGGTTGGRVLLGNNDTNDQFPISGQAYWQIAPSESATTYWEHDSTSPPTLRKNLGIGVTHTLFYQETAEVTNVLWRLNDIRLGSLFTGETPAPANNYLPWSSTCQPRTSATAEMKPAEVSYLIMRNIVNATISSPCYTNGIGTIYFDAVNGWKDDTSAKVVVEVATETSKGEIPTDENCAEGEDPFYYLTHDADGNVLAESCWRPVKPIVLFKSTGSSAFEDVSSDVVSASTKEITLHATTGGKNDEFYRVIVPMDESGACRFRIRRTSAPNGNTSNRDTLNLILLDNVIASPPPMYAEMASPGVSDEAAGRRGKQALGYAAALGKAFPSIDDMSVTGRCAVSYVITPGVAYNKGINFLASARLHYRWRYLNQKIDAAWKTLYIDHEAATGVEGEILNTVGTMELNGKVGDIEWYYDLTLQAPAYKYVDYSGCGVAKPVRDYEEARTSVTSRLNAASSTLASGGTDWFARLREGESTYEQLVLRTDRTDARAEIQMELISDHIWRGYFKTLDPIAEGFRYRIEPRNQQVDGDDHYSFNTNYWYAESDAGALPVSAVLTLDGDTNSWSRIPCDATTGYLMFQVDDSTKSIMIVHADYQDCDLWNDAKDNDIFTGNSTDDASKSAVSPKMREFDERFTTWTATPSASTNWVESFDWDSSKMTYAPYVPFGTAQSFRSWPLGPGMFIYQWFKDANAKTSNGYVRLAFQMEGCGKGWLQFPALTDKWRPRGLGEVRFKARLGQFITIDDDIAFAEYPGTATDVLKNYCFVALGAFDTNNNKDFSGDASLSLFAYYRMRRGAYELRVEQCKAKLSGSAVTGPDDGVKVISLYRWTANGAGKVSPVQLYAHTNTFAVAVQTDGETGKYLPLYISVTNETDATLIRAGVLDDDIAGINYDADLSSLSGKRFFNFAYRDKTDQRLKSGTYGVLSTNCKGVFLRPSVGQTSITSGVNLPAEGPGSTNAQSTVGIDFPTLTECKPDLEDSLEEDRWNISYGRMESFVSTNDNLWGVQAASNISQKLALEVSKRGQTETVWETAEVFTIKDFGSADNAGTSHPHRFDRTADYDVRFRVLGELDDPRTDIIIDDVEVTQWRSGDYGDRDTSSYVAPDDGYGWCSNFIFTSAWIENTNGTPTVLLSPKRTAGWDTGAKACAIRSPLMDEEEGRGIGLGLISFEWRNAQTNAIICIEIATNNVQSGNAKGYDTINPGLWTPIKTIDFSPDGPDKMSDDERKNGHRDFYLGLHGVKGLMRIVAAPSVVKQVSPVDWTNQTAYGEVEITHVYCRDEPPVNLTAWWGWNLQTTDHTNRQYLVDNLKFGSANGLSVGLNRGIQPEDNVKDDPFTYKLQMPFVQTPSFVSNDVGEVTFRARKYDTDETSPDAEVVLYGATYRPGTQDLVWRCSATDPPLATFVVSNTTYTTYTYKTKPGEGYKAFRLGVAGIEDVEEKTRGMSSRAEGADPVRVLLDEILVSEAIRPKVGFRYCRPFRNHIADNLPIADILSCDEQPIVGDSWSIQAEIAVRMLPDELDLKTHKPRVFFHWYEGLYPWGYANWRDRADANTAELSLAEGEEMVFRGSYIDSPGAVVLPTTETLSYVQYAAEVVYYDIKGNCITGVLDETEWSPRPEWYAPLDLNAKYGGATGAFSAYNILEGISPNRVWINEVNVFDGYDDARGDYPAETNQYIEIALPISQSINGWELSLITYDHQTNALCVFGQDGVAATKTANMTNDYVFLTIQSLKSKNSLDPARGEVDGTWLSYDGQNGELDQVHPIGLILKRPSGIIEQEIALEGTNWLASSDYAPLFSLTNFVAEIQASSAVSSSIYSVGNEYATPPATSLGVTNGLGETIADWTKGMRKTPGRCNEGQIIPAGYAIYPSGEMLIVYAQISGPHIRQTFGDVTNSVETALVAVKKNSAGTNIVYNLDTWYEIDSITENNVPAPGVAGRTGTFTFTTGKDQSRNVTVIAKARPRSDLASVYGLTADNRYTKAVMSWLDGGETMKGPFRNPGVISLPKYRSYRRTFTKELSLTDAYWLDIDPTGSNWVFWAGMCECPHVKETRFSKDIYGNPQLDPLGDLVKTNITLGVFMVITNETENVVDDDYAKNWSPYMLRGLAPGETSYDYTTAGDQAWTSVTFKVTGDIQNGKTARTRWIPLRYFVFGKNSFDAAHKSTIDIPDPYANYSEGAAYGWLDYIGCPVFYGWHIDTRLRPTTIELLCPTNSLNTTW